MHTGKCIQKQDIVVLSEVNVAGYLVRASGVGRVQ